LRRTLLVPTSALAASLPPGLQKASTALTLAIELGAPWGILGSRRVRLGSALTLAALQLLIAATGNYGFFNLLTLALCGCLLDDRALRHMPAPRARRSPGWLVVPRRVAAGVLAALSVLAGAQRLTPRGSLRPLRAVLGALAPLRSVNSYGLFAVMTTERPEILLEGSADGVEWRDYEFRWKPGALERAPRFAGPHMPRIDWQMWFAAMSSFDREPWLVHLVYKLLKGDPGALSLLAPGPFRDHPPRYVRALVYDYTFDGPGAWWKRQPKGTYLPAVSLEDFR